MTNKSSPCTVCDKSTTTVCSKCKIASYCSRPCQESNWRIHKFFCSSLPFPVIPKRSGGDPNIINSNKKSITGIFLGTDDLKPSLIKVAMDIKFENMMLPNTRALMGHVGESQNYMQSNPIKNVNLKDTLVFIFRDNFLNDGSPPNKSIQRLYKGKNNYPWHGPVLVIKMQGLDVCQNLYADMNVKDFEDVVDYFCWYGTTDKSRVQSTMEQLPFWDKFTHVSL